MTEVATIPAEAATRRALKPPRQKRCKHCPELFTPMSMTHVCCSIKCAVEFARAKREKTERATERKVRRETRGKLEKLKTRQQRIDEAQRAFNAFIRARDAGKPCICCGRRSSGWTRGGDWDAGHFRSRGAAPHLRFDERNCHAQLKQCNRRAWDVAAYRANLVQRIGLAEVEALESDQTTRKWSIPELIEIKREYVAKLRELDKGRGE